MAQGPGTIGKFYAQQQHAPSLAKATKPCPPVRIKVVFRPGGNAVRRLGAQGRAMGAR